MAHLRLGAGASWVEIAVRPHVCLGPLCCLFSSLTHPLFSGLGMFHAVPGAQGGDSKEEGVPAWIIDHTYCVLAPQCLLFTLYPPHSQNPAGIFPRKSSHYPARGGGGGTTWKQEFKDFHMGGEGWPTGGKQVHKTLPAGFARQVYGFGKSAGLFGEVGMLVIEERAEASSPGRGFVYQITQAQPVHPLGHPQGRLRGREISLNCGAWVRAHSYPAMGVRQILSHPHPEHPGRGLCLFSKSLPHLCQVLWTV